MEVGDPATVTADEDVALLVEAGGLGALEHDPLVQDLHGVDALRVTQLHHAHLAESTTTYHL